MGPLPWGSCQRSSPPLPMCTPPDWAHHAQSSSRTLTPRQYTTCCAAPLLPIPNHLHPAPPRSPAAQLVQSPRPGWRARHMRAKCQLSPPRPPRRCMWTRPVCVRPRSSRRVAPCHKHTAVRRVRAQPQCGVMWEQCGDIGGLRAVGSPPASERARSVPSRRPPLTSGSAGLVPHVGPKPPAPLGPYRHTTATPHAAVRISMRYRLCAGGYLRCCADCVR